MQFSEITDAVADQFGDDSSDMLTRIKRYVNWSQDEICSRIPEADFLYGDDDITTVDGTSQYTLSADADKLINISSETIKTNLSHIDRVFLDSVDPARETEGTPTMWTEVGRDATGAMIIELYPTPDSAETISYHYRKTPTDLSGDTDISIIPPKYHNILYLGALAQCYDYDQDASSLTYWTQFENKIETMKQDYMAGSEDNKNRFKPFGSSAVGSSSLRLPPDHFNN